jgi:hypothetical protein
MSRGPKPKFLDVPCPNEDCTLHGVTGKGNVIGNGTYLRRKSNKSAGILTRRVAKDDN